MTAGDRFAAARFAAAACGCVAIAIAQVGSAQGACSPAAGNNVSAVCTGVSGGYGGGGFSNLNVTVESGATVAGTPAITFNTGSLTNRGLVDGGGGSAASFNAGTVANDGTIQGSVGIDAAQAAVTNRGTIAVTGIVIANGGGSLTLDNSGVASGFSGIFTDIADVRNSGLIAATGGTGIVASTRLAISNTRTGTIRAQTVAIAAPQASISNGGLITSVASTAIDVATLSLENTGTVRGVAAGVHGTQATIVNSGLVAASGGTAIDLGGNLDLTNSGVVSGTSDGVRAATATISNSGTISGTAGRGIALTGSGTIVNSGHVSGGAYGIISVGNVNLQNSGILFGGNSALSVTGATVNNSGSILSNAVTIDAANAAIVNSGAIAGQAVAINATQLKLFNSGMVSVSGPGASAIYASQAEIANAGVIAGASTNDFALSFLGGPSVLTSLPGSRIIGRIDFGGGGGAANFRGGNFNYTFESLAGVAVSSATPFVVQGSRVVTIDPTPFGVTGRNLMAFSAAAGSVLPAAPPPMTTSGGSLNYAMASSTGTTGAREAFAAAMTPQGPSAVYSGGINMWARYFAGERDQASTAALIRTVNRFQGGLIGGDWSADPAWRLGAFVGGGAMQTSEDMSLSVVNSDVAFGGIFARGNFGAAFLDMTLQLGHLSQHGSRLVSNNLVATGFETATGNSGGFYAVPELGIGRDFDLGEAGGTRWRLTPVGRIRYLGGSLGGYSESGASANAVFGRRFLSELEARAELKLSGSMRTASGLLLTTKLYGGLLATQRLGDETVNASLLGQAIPFAIPGSKEAWGYLGGGGLDLSIGSASLFVAGEYLSMSDSSVVYGGRGGLRFAF